MCLLDLKKRASVFYLALAGASLAALFAYIAMAGLSAGWKTLVVMALVPPFFTVLALREAPRILLILLVSSLSFGARFRFPGTVYHNGGAELAIAPLDFPLAGLFLLALPGIVTAFWQRAKSYLDPLLLPFTVFALAHLASIFAAASPFLASLEFLRLFKMVLLLVVLLWYIRSWADLKLVLYVLVIAVIAQGLLAGTQWLFQASLGLSFLGEHTFWEMPVDSETVGRSGGTLGHANILAYFFELATPLAFICAASRMSKSLQTLAVVAVSAGIAGLFLTFSRAGWLGLLVGLLFVLLLLVSKQRIPRSRILTALFLFAVLVAVVGFLTRDVLAVRFRNLWGGSFQFRALTIQTAWNMIRDKPILGIGANSYLVLSYDYVPSHLTDQQAYAAALIVHNTPLLYAAEMGIVGFAALLLLAVAIGRLTWRMIQAADSQVALISLGVSGGLLAMVVHAQLDWGVRHDPVFTLLWFLVGLLLAMQQMLARNSTSTAQAPKETGADMDGIPPPGMKCRDL